MLDRYGLTPDQLYALDPDFVESISERLRAESDVRRDQEARAKLRNRK